jgi:hypothetical protein
VKVDDEKGRQLAEKVRRALELAGFSAYISDFIEDPPGFAVVRGDFDESGQVFLEWRTSRTLLEASLKNYPENEDDPVRNLRHKISRQMAEVAISILTDMGFRAFTTENEDYPTADVEVRYGSTGILEAMS